MGTPFVKMHGLGNDFVVLDARSTPVAWDEATYRAVADRRTGVGCDQFMVIRPARRGGDAYMEIRNADGGEVEACGNGARCVAVRLFGDRDAVAIETAAGIVRARRAGSDRVEVDMGPVRVAPTEIPLAREADTLRLPLAHGPLSEPVAANVGNPHVTFLVDDADAVDIERWGPLIEHDPLFPERVNVGIAGMRGRFEMRFRVWERGVGVTRACGTGACAAVAAAVRRGVGGRDIAVHLDGGRLDVRWREADGHAVMVGPAVTSFTGVLPG